MDCRLEQCTPLRRARRAVTKTIQILTSAFRTKTRSPLGSESVRGLHPIGAGKRRATPFLDKQLLDRQLKIVDLILQLRAFVRSNAACDHSTRHAAGTAQSLLVRDEHVRNVLQAAVQLDPAHLARGNQLVDDVGGDKGNFGRQAPWMAWLLAGNGKAARANLVLAQKREVEQDLEGSGIGR